MEAKAREWDIVTHYEGKLPRPENYRKRTTRDLRNTLRRVNRDLKLSVDFLREKGHEGNMVVVEMTAMFRKHRRLILKVLAARITAKGARDGRQGTRLPR